MIKLEFLADFTSTAGYAAHARLMLRALHRYNTEARGVQLKIVNRTKETNQVDLSPADAEIIAQYHEVEFDGKPDVRLYFEPAQWVEFEEGVKSISFCQWETTKIRNYAHEGVEQLNWVEQFNKCDLVLTSCNDAVEAYTSCGVETRCEAIPGPIFPHTVKGELPIEGLTVQPRTYNEILRENRPVVIGYMAQWSVRKNIEAFIRDLTIGFNRGEVVGLLKTYRHQFGDPDQIINTMRVVRDSCRRPAAQTPKIILISDKLSDDDVMRYFNTVDIYYAPSRGEGYGLPVAMAAAAGCIPVVPDFGGPRDFLPGECIVPGSFSPCIGMKAYDSDQFWVNIDEEQAISKLQAMRSDVKMGAAQPLCDEVRDLALGVAGADIFVHRLLNAVKSVLE